jgi:hypothetical protein
MKRTSILLAPFILLLSLTAPAGATVWYDWRCVSVIEGAEYSFNASLPLDDLEYKSGSFKIPFQEIGDLHVDFNFSGISRHDTWTPRPFEFWYDFYLLGTLTDDKKKIQALVGYTPEFDHYFNDIIYDQRNYDAGASISSNYLLGSCEIPIVFGLYDLNASQFFAHNGEWVVREDTVPVPEPGTFAFFALGAIGLTLIRRSTSCTLPPPM